MTGEVFGMWGCDGQFAAEDTTSVNLLAGSSTGVLSSPSPACPRGRGPNGGFRATFAIGEFRVGPGVWSRTLLGGYPSVPAVVSWTGDAADLGPDAPASGNATDAVLYVGGNLRKTFGVWGGMVTVGRKSSTSRTSFATFQSDIRATVGFDALFTVWCKASDGSISVGGGFTYYGNVVGPLGKFEETGTGTCPANTTLLYSQLELVDIHRL